QSSTSFLSDPGALYLTRCVRMRSSTSPVLLRCRWPSVLEDRPLFGMAADRILHPLDNGEGRCPNVLRRIARASGGNWRFEVGVPFKEASAHSEGGQDHRARA